MNIEIVITWHENNPVSFWFEDKLIWEANKIITDVNLLKTKVSLPLVEAIKFSTIFINGLTADRLLLLLIVIQTKLKELNELKKLNDEAEEYNISGDNEIDW